MFDVAHGYIEASRFHNFGAMVRYHCDPGYKLRGPEIRICQADRQWSGPHPVCEAFSKNVLTFLNYFLAFSSLFLRFFLPHPI